MTSGWHWLDPPEDGCEKAKHASQALNCAEREGGVWDFFAPVCGTIDICIAWSSSLIAEEEAISVYVFLTNDYSD